MSFDITPYVTMFVGVLIGLCIAALLWLLRFNRRMARGPQESSPAKTVTSERSRAERVAYIRAYRFPQGLIDRALRRCPRGTDAAIVEAGMRQFFIAAATSPDMKAAMPSKTVDEVWHEFMTFTRQYQDFCSKAMPGGQFLHHQPEYLMSAADAAANQGSIMLATWDAACDEEGLSRSSGSQAPALFAVDHDAGVKHGDQYVPQCGTTTHCSAKRHVVCVQHALRKEPFSRPTQPAPAAELTAAITRRSEAARRSSSLSSSSRSVASSRRSDSGTTDTSASMLPLYAAGVYGSSDTGSSYCAPDTSSSTSSSCDTSSSSSSSSSSCGSSSSSSSCGGSSCGGGGCGS